MKIMMIAGEALPFSKTGGLGDVLFSLTEALAPGNEVKLFIPCYADNLNDSLTPLFQLTDTVSGAPLAATVYSAASGAPFETFLIREDTLITRKGAYAENGVPYFDNCQRFSLFSRLALDALLALGWIPDLIHLHDWHTALIPSYLQCDPWRTPLGAVPTVFSIHNLGYQGNFSLRSMHFTGLPGSLLPTLPETPDEINFMAAALRHASKITTVSPSYSREILTEPFSHRLSELLIERENDLSGILNGIDLEKWNPQTDPFLAAPFQADDLSGKHRCKAALTQRFSFPDPSWPLIAVITRLALQKGINELFLPETGAMEAICSRLPVNVIAIGTGEAWCEERLKAMTDTYDNFIGITTFDEALSHQTEAAADFFLMPSVYEPCGLNQMYSSHYGCLPIVRCTGGLADTVIPQTGDIQNATGYSFYQLTPKAIFDTVQWALTVYRERPELHQKMIRNGMERDFSWHKSAGEYLDLYRSLVTPSPSEKETDPGFIAEN